MNAPNKFRLRNHPTVGTDDGYGNNGMFVIPHPKISGYFYQCVMSDGHGWEHVSVTLKSKERKIDRCPTWAEMCYVKEIFWDDEEEVMQLHPKKSDYVNFHPYCLHLWRPKDAAIPIPDSLMVGIKSENIKQDL